MPIGFSSAPERAFLDDLFAAKAARPRGRNAARLLGGRWVDGLKLVAGLGDKARA